ncbi:Ribonuclease T2-like 1-B [Candida viswanathii]|uniref:ribonuclease T2 n=1 Tax=Candida viswanathii TaxID=5486 RepID=A0A367YH58_9ASCO|nr:Ribonuclease T2-like 1-B [Candida viswanathii]
MTHTLAILTTLITLSTSQFIFQQAPSCPINPPISCSREALVSSEDDDVSTCCFESPAGIIELTQFWDYNPATGPSDLFTAHGLWNMYCGGHSYPQSCDRSLAVPNNGATLRDIIVDQFGDQALYDGLSSVWKDIRGDDAQFWAHEWNKHGTCFSTIKPGCYDSREYRTNQNVYDFFRTAYFLFQKVPTFEWLGEAGVVPSDTETYSAEQVLGALKGKFGKDVYFKCDSSGAINEVWYYFNVRGPLLNHDFLPIDALSHTNCPSTGIKFPPKGSKVHPGPPQKPPHATKTYGPVPTGVPERSYIDLTGKPGCLISNGRYYTSGTCATYHFAVGSKEDSVQVISSKGVCGVDKDGNFVCNRSNELTRDQFTVRDGAIGYYGQYEWCLGKSLGSGSTAQTFVRVSDGSCDSFQLTVQK